MDKIIVADANDIALLIENAVHSALAKLQLPIKVEPFQHSEKEFLSLIETAEFLNLAPQTIYGMTSRGQIPVIKRSKKLMFEKSKLIHWIKTTNKNVQSK